MHLAYCCVTDEYGSGRWDFLGGVFLHCEDLALLGNTECVHDYSLLVSSNHFHSKMSSSSHCAVACSADLFWIFFFNVKFCLKSNWFESN